MLTTGPTLSAWLDCVVGAAPTGIAPTLTTKIATSTESILLRLCKPTFSSTFVFLLVGILYKDAFNI
jgi:hypothetical protein